MKIKSILVSFLLLASKTNFSQLLHADFNETETLTDYVSANPQNQFFNAIGSSGAGVQVSILQGQLQFNRNATNTGSFSRTTNFTGNPNALALQIQVKVSDNSAAQTNAAVFQVGAGFGTNNAAETNANVHSRFAINFTANAGEFSLRDLGTSTNSVTLQQSATLLWVINNTGNKVYYRNPAGNIDSLSNDTWDLWAGSTLLFNDRNATTSAQNLEDLKFAFTAGTGKIAIDQIMVDLPQSLNHFRSNATVGSWLNQTHWESSIDSINWSTPNNLPSGLSASIYIKPNQTMVFSGSGSLQFSTANDLFIDSTATLLIGDSLGQNNNQVFTLIKAGNYFNAVNAGNLIIHENAHFKCKGQLLSLGNIQVKSSAAGTGNIGNSQGGNISGVVSVERYIPAIARRNRNLSTPIANNTLQDWQGEIFITGNGIGSTLGATNSNGFDATVTNNPSVFWYNETDTGSLNLGWKAATHISSHLIPGRGYKVMVRGDRTDLGRINGTVSTQNAVTLISTGTLNQGDITFPSSNITWSGNTANDGWCFIGNPYACNINWNAPSGWTRNNVDAGAIAIWNPQTNSYAYSVQTIGGANPLGISVNGGSPIIASHQAFFVRTTGNNPSLSCNENVKTQLTSTPLFKGPTHNLVKLKLVKDDINIDESILLFNEQFSVSETELEDLPKLKNNSVNIGSGQNPKRWLAVNALPLQYTDSFTIPIYAETADLDSATLSIDIKPLNAFESLIIIDLLNKKHYNITGRFEQKFCFKALETNQARFLLTGKHQQSLGIQNLETNNIKVYPNPAEHCIYIEGSQPLSSFCQISLYDMQGRGIPNLKLSQHSNKIQLELNEVPQGVYLLKIQDGNHSLQQKIIKP